VNVVVAQVTDTDVNKQHKLTTEVIEKKNNTQFFSTHLHFSILSIKSGHISHNNGCDILAKQFLQHSFLLLE
jgi:hypothetical protein